MRQLCWVLCAGLSLNAAGIAQSGNPPKKLRVPLHVGTTWLEPCPRRQGYCGHIDRPLDPAGAVPGRINVHFEYYRHSGPGAALGTVVATEGGPGYPATESRGDYLALFAPLLVDHDLVLMDNRGTGQSGAIDCGALQRAVKWTVELIAACGVSLGPAAPLYSTAYAADDLDAILEALAVHRIDLYGDSYGTYFEQVFAVRHPARLRSLVLDGAYPLSGPDYAWYPTYAPAMQDKFNLACRRFAPCAALPGTSIEHMLPVLRELRSRPFRVHAADADGTEREFTADASQLAIVMFANAPAFSTVRELDAASRAFADGDRRPLLRLMAETIRDVDSRDPSADPTKWSAGLAAAVMCQDAPQIFDMRLAPLPRAADRDRTIAARTLTHPDTYAPFTIDEYRGMPLDYSFIDQCTAWPVAPPTHPASHVVAADATYPDVPALVLSGEFDNITTLADGAAVARAFKHGIQLRIANSFHVNALRRARSACGAQVVRRFIAALQPGDTRCAADIPPLRLVARFAERAAQLEPALPLPGNQAGATQLQAVSAAVLTAGDVLTRVDDNATGRGVGLRGGTFRVRRAASGLSVTLDKIRWVADLAVSGRIERSRRRDRVRALLWFATSGSSARVAATWSEDLEHPTAVIRGTLGRRSVRAQTPAP